MISYQRNTF